MSLAKKSILFIVLILIADQVLKIWIKTHLVLGEVIPLFGNWGNLLFIENNGMAFGWEMGGSIGKLLLSLFRIVAIIAIGGFLVHIVKRGQNTAFVLAVSAIFAGAIGNIIDSAFYGMIFSDSFSSPATLFPPEGGYSSFLHGKVVDMFYFPIINTTLPEWFPIYAGRDFIFFRPVFNIADSAITCGVLSILLFQKKMLKDLK